MSYLTAIAFYLLLQTPAFANSDQRNKVPLKNFSATYNLYHNDFYVGQSTRKLKIENKILTFSSITKTDGIASLLFNITITEISKLHYKNKRLHFFSYNNDENNNGKSESYLLRLDKDNKFYNSHEKKLHPATKNLHDTLGFTLAIMHDMQIGKREIKYTIAEKDNIKSYTLKLVAKEDINTNKGVLSTFKMEHYDPKTNHRFTFWCAESLGFLPIKIRNINHKGDVNLLKLSQFNHKTINIYSYDEDID